MLYVHTVQPGTLGLLKKIMSIPELAGFNLAGGTSLRRPGRSENEKYLQCF